jgi:hypothetical protein
MLTVNLITMFLIVQSSSIVKILNCTRSRMRSLHTNIGSFLDLYKKKERIFLVIVHPCDVAVIILSENLGRWQEMLLFSFRNYSFSDVEDQISCPNILHDLLFCHYCFHDHTWTLFQQPMLYFGIENLTIVFISLFPTFCQGCISWGKLVTYGQSI